MAYLVFGDTKAEQLGNNYSTINAESAKQTTTMN